ncbi:T6SS phospholipase effector Tle1-like catalytic domain-containing protein [Pseudomonas helleri]|uniref:T6SS phospholipase effector Tle1-like catalytic domain-containing protein n=1 Tax=Pseudomonas helleri TaxID=1608996 RepID=UPI0037C8657F
MLDALKVSCREQRLAPADAYALIQKMGTSVGMDALGASLVTDGYARRKAVLEAVIRELQKKVELQNRMKTAPLIKAMRLYVYGFSRGAAEARTFANWLEALTKVEVEGETCYLFAGLPISIAFMGLFDTVASVGVAYLAPFASGHMGWADNSLRLSDSEVFLERCVHLVSAHEQRACFPLDSIRRKARPDDPLCPSTYRNNTVEYLYPGMHSDVGGGYPPGDQGKSREGSHEVLSQIALHHMFSEAYKVGAPLQAPRDSLHANQRERSPWLIMEDETLESYDVSESLIQHFNTWRTTLIPGPLETAMEHQAGLITGWRINRYASYWFEDLAAFSHVSGKYPGESPDMTAEEREAFKALHGMQLAEDQAARSGQPLPEWSDSERAARTQHEQTKRAFEQRIGASTRIAINTAKTFEPALDHAQLRAAMNEFRRDYLAEWQLPENSEMFSLGRFVNMAAGGLVYLTNEEDEAQQYVALRRAGNRAYKRLFTEDNKTRDDEAKQLLTLFDDYVHDSRAWFMHSSLGEREPFSDYFRYRTIFFDDESNKALSLLARAGQVVGVAVAIASVGLSIKRRDPRYLVGLIIPSLGLPVFRGQVGAPEFSAIDTLTCIALPMLEDTQGVRTFTQNPRSALKLLDSLPLPPALDETTAATPALQAVLTAALAAAAVRKAEKEAAYQASLTPEDKRRLLEAEELEERKRQWVEQAKAAASKL